MKGCITDLSPLSAANGFIRSWPRLIHHFLGSHESAPPDGISIGSPIFAQLTAVSNIQTHTQTHRPCYRVRVMRPNNKKVRLYGPALALRSSGVTITTNLTAHSFLNISYDHRRTDRMHFTAAMPLFAINTCHRIHTTPINRLISYQTITNNYVRPRNTRTEMYAGHVVCCPLVSHVDVVQ